jgi:DNA-binding SARP family transcriptional activator
VAAHRPASRTDHGHVLLTQAAAEHLFPDTPTRWPATAVTIAPPAVLLDAIEAELLARHRRRANGDHPPLSPMAVIAVADELGHDPRTTAVIIQAVDLDITVIHLTHTDTGAAGLQLVNDYGTELSLTGGVARLSHLTATEADAVLSSLTEVTSPDPDTPTPSDPGVLDTTTPALPAGESTPAPAAEPPRDDVVATGADTGGAPARPALVVRILGCPAQIPGSAGGPPMRAKAREILTYLLLHPAGVSDGQLIDDVLGDSPVRGVNDRLNTYVYNLRQVLKHADGDHQHLHRDTSARYIRLEAAHVDCDLWRMRRHIAAAATSSDPRAELSHALDQYTGPVAAGTDYEWIEPHREAARRDATTAAAQLADLLAPADPDGAECVLRTAIAHSPYTEALYQQLIHLHTGKPHLITAIIDDLTRRLTDIDTEPTPTTLRLAEAASTATRAATQRRPTPDPSA